MIALERIIVLATVIYELIKIDAIFCNVSTFNNLLCFAYLAL